MLNLIFSLLMATLTVDAGPDQTVQFGFKLSPERRGQIQLHGTVGISSSGQKTDFLWVKVKGPETTYIIDPKSLDTLLVVDRPGKYQLMLLAGDGLVLVNDIVNIIVKPQ